MVKPKSISEIQRWVMENSYLELRWRTTIHGAKQKRWRENQSLCELMHWGRGLRIYMVKGEDWRRNGKGYIWFSAKNFGGIAICKSRDIGIATGSCLSWNANFCWFQNAIPQISPSQTFPDFCDLINGRLALSIRLNKRALAAAARERREEKAKSCCCRWRPKL